MTSAWLIRAILRTNKSGPPASGDGLASLSKAQKVALEAYVNELKLRFRDQYVATLQDKESHIEQLETELARAKDGFHGEVEDRIKSHEESLLKVQRDAEKYCASVEEQHREAMEKKEVLVRESVNLLQ